MGEVPGLAQSASDLKGFASRDWLVGLLDPAKIITTNYFGGTTHKAGKMVKFVNRDVANYGPEQKEKLRKVIAAVSAEAQLKAQLGMDQRDATMIQEGAALLQNEIACTDCHQFHKPDPDAFAPNLGGYGSRRWLIGFISNPAHADY